MLYDKEWNTGATGRLTRERLREIPPRDHESLIVEVCEASVKEWYSCCD